MDFLSKKMSDIKKAKGDEYRFAIRELVQNADDANAKMVVIRLDSDAIYVANDGYAFRPPSGKFEGDYFRICRVLSKPKAKEAESTGAHGSGFQTVYCFTNHPELHSAGISARMDPTRHNENERIVSISSKNEPKSRSPYFPQGVLFRFPWRTDKEASREYEGKRYFESEEWPAWNPKAIARIAEDLAHYLHDLILCCQRVESIRLIWGNPPNGYQVQRADFRLNQIDEREPVYEASITESQLEVPDDWELSFREHYQKHTKKASSAKTWRYLVQSGHVTDEAGHIVHYGETKHGKALVTADLGELRDDKDKSDGKKFLLKNNIHLLFPLFDSGDREAA
jgi:hypothetical protein